MDFRHKSVPPLVPPKSPTIMKRNKQHLSQQNLSPKGKISNINNNNKRLENTSIKKHLIGEHKRNSLDMEIVDQPQQQQQLSEETEKLKRSFEKLNETTTTTFHKTSFLSLSRRRKSSSQISDESATTTISAFKSWSTNNSNDQNNHNNNNQGSTDVSSFCPVSQQQQSKPDSIVQQSPLVISSRVSLPLKLSKLSLGGLSSSSTSSTDSNNSEIPPSKSEILAEVQSATTSPDVKILVNDVEVKLRKDGGFPNPRRPMKRKSQDYDRNFLNESGCLASTRHNSDFWLPKVKVTPSMLTQLNTEMLAHFTISQDERAKISQKNNNGNDEQSERRDRMTQVIEFLQEFFNTNGFLQPGERITDAVETLSTRILTPSDPEHFTILTTAQVINVSFCSKKSSTIKVLGIFPLIQITRILTDPDLSLIYLLGPEIEIVTGDSQKTEKLISSILVAALRAQKSQTLTTTKDQQQQNFNIGKVTSPSRVGSSREMSNNPVAEFLEVSHVSNTLEMPFIYDTFKKLFPSEKQIFYSSAVVVRFDQMAPDNIEVPVRIQVADQVAEGTEFKASILKLSGCSLSFCNPIRTFFTYNPGEELTNIDVTNPSKFSVKRIETPKPNSLLITHMEDFLLVETPGSQQAEEIFQRIITIQQNAAIGDGKQVAHIFITEQSLLAFKIHTYENIFQIPILNLVKLHKPLNQPSTCILELESTEAMDFIPQESPCWSLTFNDKIQKNKFINHVSHFLQEEEKSS